MAPVVADTVERPSEPDLVLAIPQLRRYARLLIGHRAGADDLVEETLTLAWRRLRRLNKAGDLRPALFKIMRSLYVKRPALAEREKGNLTVDTNGGERAAGQIVVEENWPSRVEFRELAESMGHLSADEREVLLLAAVEELPYQDIAAVLAVSVECVVTRLSSAREKLSL